MKQFHDRYYRGDAFRIVRGASGHADKVVFVFQCYLDDSGTSGLPIVTLAGFVTRLSVWEEIEPLTEAVMSGYGVPVFHAKEFHDTDGCFKGWSRIKKHSFVKELFLPIRKTMSAVSVTVRKSGVVDMQKATGEHVNMSPYGFCFAAIMSNLLTQNKLAREIRSQGISFLIESGNHNNPGVEKYFHKMSKQPAFEGCLRSISFIAKDSCRAIQLADYWTFYSRRMMRENDRFSGKLALPANFYHEVIYRNFDVWERAAKDFPGEAVGRLEEMKNLDDLIAAKTAAPIQPKRKA